MSAPAGTNQKSNDSRFMHTAIVYYDLETTGLNTHTAETIELAAQIDPACKQAYEAYFRANRDWQSLPVVSDTFEALVCPDSGAIPEGASKVNGIFIDHVKDKPKFGDVAAQFVEWLQKWRRWCPPTCEKILVVAHNNFDYDSRILMRQCIKHKVALPDFVSFGDSLVAFRECFPFPQRRYNMQALTNLWVPKDSRLVQDHRAASDVKMLILVIQRCPDVRFFLDVLMQKQQPLKAK